MNTSRKILVLGASGLIGRFVTDDLRARGFRGGRRRAQALSPRRGSVALDLEMPVMSMDAAALAQPAARARHRCRRQLPRRAAGRPRQRHQRRASRFRRAAACRRSATAAAPSASSTSRSPATAESDRTAFATTKREAERLIAASGVAYAILRPGFVVAPSAYGGSAMLRALAAFPLDLPAQRARRRRSSRSRSRIFPPPSPGSPRAIRPRRARRDMGPDAAAGRSRSAASSASSATPSARKTGRASRCRPSCSISAPRLGDLANLARLDAADAHHRDRRIAPRRDRRSRALDGRHRHRAEDASTQMVGQPLRHHPGQMVRAAVPGQGAGHRKPRAVLARLRLHRAGDFLSPRPASWLARLSRRRWSRRSPILTSLMDMSIGVLIAFRRTCAFGLDRRHRGLARLYGGHGDPDARPLDRAARRAGENRPRDRADAGRAAELDNR